MLARQNRMLTFGSITLIGLVASIAGAVTQSPETAVVAGSATQGVLSFLRNNGITIGSEILKNLGGLSSNVLAADIHSLLDKPVKNLIKNAEVQQELTRAVREAISAIIIKEATELTDAKDKKALVKITKIDEAGWSWVELLEKDSLVEISEDQLPNLFSQNLEDINKTVSPVSSKQWKHFLLELSRHADSFISEEVLNKVANSLYENFPQVLRAVFLEDFSENGESYGKLVLNLIGDINARVKDIQSKQDKTLEKVDKILRHLTSKSVISAESNKKQIHNLPTPNIYFTGREDVLSKIEEILIRRKRVALLGHSGIGKTRTAIEYALQNIEKYAKIIYIPASSEGLNLSIQNTISELIEVPESLQSEQLAQHFVSWLDSNSDWLLIFDNVDDINLIKQFLPTTRQGHILFTTTLPQINTLTQLIKLKELSVEEGATLLTRRKLHNPDASLDDISTEEIKYAKKLSKEVQGLPLFLNIAGSYIGLEEVSIESFYNFYTRNKEKVLKINDIADNYQNGSVFVAFSLIYEAIGKPKDDSENEKIISKAAQKLLQICAFLAPQEIPEGVILEYFSTFEDDLTVITVDEMLWKTVLRKVRDFGLLDFNEENFTIKVHSLVQEVTKLYLDEKSHQKIIENIIYTINLLFPKPNYINRWEYELLIPHTLNLISYLDDFEIQSESLITLTDNCGNHFEFFGGYEQGLKLYCLSRDLSEKIYGSEHPFTLDESNSIGEMHRKLGNIDTAIEIFEKLLTLEGQINLKMPRLLFPIKSNLAHCYVDKGRLKEAESLLLEATKTAEEDIEENIYDLSHLYNNLAGLYIKYDDDDKSLEYLSKTLEINLERFGIIHPLTLVNYNNLAQLLFGKGDIDEALYLHKKILRGRKIIYGTQHYDLGITNYNIGFCYSNKGKLENALMRLNRALSIFTKEFGEHNHPKIAECLYTIGSVYAKQKRFQDAETSFVKSVEVTERLIGKNAPFISYVLAEAAVVYGLIHKTELAFSAMERAVQIAEDVYGKDSPKAHDARGLYLFIWIRSLIAKQRPIDILGNSKDCSMEDYNSEEENTSIDIYEYYNING